VKDDAFYSLALGALCVWRITHFLYAEDGPWDIMVHLRRKAGEGFWGKLLDCFYCLSVWIAAPFGLLLGHGWAHRCILWLAISAGASLLERATDRGGTPPAPYIEDKEDEDALLRPQERTDPRDKPDSAGS
jgi:hypothetical protein